MERHDARQAQSGGASPDAKANGRERGNGAFHREGGEGNGEAHTEEKETWETLAEKVLIDDIVIAFEALGVSVMDHAGMDGGWFARTVEIRHAAYVRLVPFIDAIRKSQILREWNAEKAAQERSGA